MVSVTKKKVAYLLGAGATHAVLHDLSPTRGLLTSHIQDYLAALPSVERLTDETIWNELLQQQADIEHLISLLESQYDSRTTEQLRKLYRSAILELAKDISQVPPSKNLYSVLFSLHDKLDDQIGEALACFITLNYEDILERTVQTVFNRPIDYLISTTTLVPTLTLQF